MKQKKWNSQAKSLIDKASSGSYAPVQYNGICFQDPATGRSISEVDLPSAAEVVVPKGLIGEGTDRSTAVFFAMGASAVRRLEENQSISSTSFIVKRDGEWRLAWRVLKKGGGETYRIASQEIMRENDVDRALFTEIVAILAECDHDYLLA